MKINKTYKMVIVVCVCTILSGCALFKGAFTPDPERPGYKAGKLAYAAYLTAVVLQTEETARAMKDSYSVLKMAFSDSAYPLDAHISEWIKDEFSEETVEYRQLIFSFYSLGRQELESVLMQGQDIPMKKILNNFVHGVEDAKGGAVEQKE